jgi:hypothetical protein
MKKFLIIIAILASFCKSEKSFSQVKAGSVPGLDLIKYLYDYGSSFGPTTLIDREYADSADILRMRYTDSAAALAPYYRLPGLFMLPSGHIIGADTSSATGFSAYYVRKADSTKYYYPYYSNPRGFISGNQTITFTGDATGSGTTSVPLTLATVNSAPGSYGSSNQVAVVTVNAKGLVTSSSTTSIAFPVTSVFGRSGAITMNATDISTALGFSPAPISGSANYVNINPGSVQSGFMNISGRIQSGDTTTNNGAGFIMPNMGVFYGTSSTSLQRIPLFTILQSGNFQIIPFMTFQNGFLSNGPVEQLNNVFFGAKTFNNASEKALIGLDPTNYCVVFPNGGSVAAFRADSVGGVYLPSLTSSFNPSVQSILICDSTSSPSYKIYKSYRINQLPVSSSQITTGLGYTPYNSTNPSGYITSSALASYVQLTPSSQQLGSINVSSTITAGDFILPNGGNITALQYQSPYSQTAILTLDQHNHTLIGNGGVYTDSAGDEVIPGNLSVGSLTVARKTASIVYSFGAGTGATISVSGDGTSGRITLTTGTSPQTTNEVFDLTLSSAYPNSSGMVIQGANAAAAALTPTQQLICPNGGAGSNASFAYSSGSTALAAGTTYIWMYVINGD